MYLRRASTAITVSGMFPAESEGDTDRVEFLDQVGVTSSSVVPGSQESPVLAEALVSCRHATMREAAPLSFRPSLNWSHQYRLCHRTRA